MSTVTPDARPPFSIRRMRRADGAGVTHIIARDGFTIIATVNHDRDGIAENLGAAPELLEAARGVYDPAEHAHEQGGGRDCFICRVLAGAIAKAEARQ